MNIVKRKELVNSIMDCKTDYKVKLLCGVRGCGKSTLLDLIIEELKRRGVREDKIFKFSFFSCKLKNKSYTELYEYIAGKITEKSYLFFDDVDSFDRWQSILYFLGKDFDCEVYAAVNYSQFFTKEDRFYLIGKSQSFNICPFSFKEFVEYHNEFGSENKSTRKLFSDYVKIGGMPDLFEKHINHNDLLDFIVNQEFSKVTGVRGFSCREFLEYMIFNFTDVFSRRDIERYEYLDLNNNELNSLLYVLNNSQFMLESGVAFDSNSFNLKTKYYLIDHGFYKLVYHNHLHVFQRIIKNIIFVELLQRGYKVFFKQKRGVYVDFICHNFKRHIAIQFNSVILNEHIIQREIDDLNTVPDYFEKYIITTSDYDLSDYGIKHLNVIDFLLGDEI